MDDNNKTNDTNNTNDGIEPVERTVPPATRRIQVTDEFSSPTQMINTTSSVPDNRSSVLDDVNRVTVEQGSDETTDASEPTADKDSMVGTEHEPTTQTITSEPVATENQAVVSPERSTIPAASSPEAVVAPVTDSTLKKQSDKKRTMLFIAAGAIGLVILGALAWWLLVAGNKEDNSRVNEDASSATIQQPKLGIAITVADGSIEYMQSEGEWQIAGTDTQLQEGDSVKAGQGSRAVLTLDDGSAVRLDANTTVIVESLAADNIIIKQVEGTMYSRVVPSDRTYSVAVNETTYEALGTAFITMNKQDEKGVQVYQSSVKASGSSDTITEGNQFYKLNADTALENKVTAISIDESAQDAFVNWNLSQDESDENFNQKLGVLSQVKQRGEEINKERQAEEARKALAEKEAIEKREAEEKQSETSGKVTRGEMILKQLGDTLTWDYTGKAIHGYKLVYSESNPTPTFGKDEAIYFSSMSETDGNIPSRDKIGKGEYKVRVCAYTANTEDEGCVDYSNIVVVRR